MSCTGDTSGRPFVEIVWAGGSQAGGRLILHAAELGRWVRRHAALSDAPHAAAQVADAWLARTFETFTDPLRRAAVAAMALDLTRRLKEGTTAETGEHQAALSALYRRLRRTGAYVRSTYDLDLGLVSGLHLPIPPFRVTAPARFHGEAAPLRLRKAAGLGLRLARSHGLPVAADWAHRARLGAWIELHLDLRGAHAFNPQGFATAYRTVAEVLRGRPDLAGVRAGSWLFDPTLARISPRARLRAALGRGGRRALRGRAHRSGATGLRGRPLAIPPPLDRDRRLYASLLHDELAGRRHDRLVGSDRRLNGPGRARRPGSVGGRRSRPAGRGRRFRAGARSSGVNWPAGPQASDSRPW